MNKPHGAGRTLYLVDGTSQLFRAYFALPPMNNADGMPTNALYGFTNMLRKLLNEHSPTSMAVVFDPPGRSFRVEKFADYKANRPPTPPDLKVQAPLARDVCRVLGIPVAELEGFEADDVIATFAARGKADGYEVAIVGSDKDLFQLVGEGIRVYNPTKEVWLDAEGVCETFGVVPDRVLDVQALSGDSVDNIPGVPGVGEKSSVAIVSAYDDLDAIVLRAERFVALLAARDSVIGAIDTLDQAETVSEAGAAELVDSCWKLDEALAELAPVERAETLAERWTATRELLAGSEVEELATKIGQPGRKSARSLKPLKRDLKALDKGTAKKQWMAIHENADSARLSRELAKLRIDVPLEPSVADLAVREPSNEEAYELFRRLDFRAWIAEFKEGGSKPSASTDETPVESVEHETILNADALEAFVLQMRAAGRVTVEAYGNDGDPLRGGLLGLGLSAGPSRSAYLPLRHEYLGAPDGLPAAVLQESLGALLGDAELPKDGHDLKTTVHRLHRAGFGFAGWGLDTMLAGFLIDASRPDYSRQRLAREHLGIELDGLDVVTGSGAKRIPTPEVEVERFSSHVGETLVVTSRLVDHLGAELDRLELRELYRSIDGPLLPLLVEMEEHGILVDTGVLKAMSAEMESTIDGLRVRIHQLAGEEFNVDSPKQLREVLFEKLALKSRRKTAKSKVASTDAQTLEELVDQHEIAGELLEYRELTKLKSTYVDSLPRLVHPETGRVHTSFHPTGAATGRLSSSDPNLQNIPVRSEAGRKIRRAFVAGPGHQFLASDYSQVELRVLAHLCDDPGLKAAFAAGEDIHRYTASRVSGLAPERITATMRRRAKAVNFGILYGMSETRLAREQGMRRSEAKQFIQAYFERFANVRDYIDRVREQALRDGAGAHAVRSGALLPAAAPEVQRAEFRSRRCAAAVNTTIQGTAADLMKLAMLRVDEALAEQGLGARILLQVHDELLLEVPEGELEATRHTVREAMEGVHPLSVPLAVDQKAGPNWYEMA